MPRRRGSVLRPDEDVGVRLVRLLAVALATGCFVVTGELWSSALNPAPTIVFPTPVQPPPRLLPGDLSRHGPPAIVRLKPVPTYPLPRARGSAHGHGKAGARHGRAAHRAGLPTVVARRRSSTPPVAPAALPAAPAPAPPAKPAPGPKPPPKPAKSPGPPTPPAPTPPPTPTPPTPGPAPPSAEASPPAQVETPPAGSTPSSTPTPPPQPATPPAPPTAAPEPPTPPTPPTPPQASGTRPGHGYGDENHTHTGPPGQPGP